MRDNKVVPINFRKRAIIQFKIAKDIRNPKNGAVVGQREAAITKVFPPQATIYQVMKYVESASEGIGEGCMMLFESDNEDLEDEEEGTDGDEPKH